MDAANRLLHLGICQKLFAHALRIGAIIRGAKEAGEKTVRTGSIRTVLKYHSDDSRPSDCYKLLLKAHPLGFTCPNAYLGGALPFPVLRVTKTAVDLSMVQVIGVLQVLIGIFFPVTGFKETQAVSP